MATTKNEPGTIWSEGPCSLNYLFLETESTGRSVQPAAWQLPGQGRAPQVQRWAEPFFP